MTNQRRPTPNSVFAALCLLCALAACHSEETRQQDARREIELTQLIADHPGVPIANGQRVFERQCATCHHADGTGTRNAIPPLRRHVAALLRAPGGAAYLPQVVLYGVSGAIEADGVAFLNRMPSLGPLLRDEEVFAALAYVSRAWGNDGLAREATQVSRDDVGNARAHSQSSAQTYGRRPALVAATTTAGND